MNAINNITKTNGVDGEYIKVIITIDGKQYKRITRPDGSNQYANITNEINKGIRSGGPSATMIDKAIAALM